MEVEVVGVADVYLYKRVEASPEEQLIVLLRQGANVDIVVEQEQVAEFEMDLHWSVHFEVWECWRLDQNSMEESMGVQLHDVEYDGLQGFPALGSYTLGSESWFEHAEVY